MSDPKTEARGCYGYTDDAGEVDSFAHLVLFGYSLDEPFPARAARGPPTVLPRFNCVSPPLALIRKRRPRRTTLSSDRMRSC